ncbi:MAG TPA: electron transport complex subunit RsxG [Gammaproteobacteria bacterium]
MLHAIAASAGVLLLFAVAGTALVAVIRQATAERIAENERQALLAGIHALVPPAAIDNDPFSDTVQVTAPEAFGSAGPVTVYRARKGGREVAAVFTVVAPDGYSGAIRLLVGVHADGRLAGARVVAHKETPGLGDKIEAQKSDWILGFGNRTLQDPGPAGWAVKKDGGVFDQFTGATITPRAVVAAVHRALVYFNDHREALFLVAQREESKDG